MDALTKEPPCKPGQFPPHPLAGGFVFLDRDLRFVRINDQLGEINGLPVEAHVGRTVAEILPTLLEPALREVTERVLATGLPVSDREFNGKTPRAPGITRGASHDRRTARRQPARRRCEGRVSARDESKLRSSACALPILQSLDGTRLQHRLHER